MLVAAGLGEDPLPHLGGDALALVVDTEPDVTVERGQVDPDRALAGACAAIGLPFTRAMVTGRAAAAHGLIKDFEAWKGDNTKPLQYRPRARFTEVFDAETHAAERARAAAEERLIAELGQALRGDELELHYQPIIDLLAAPADTARGVYAVEALVR